jgi:hypothetical protein
MKGEEIFDKLRSRIMESVCQSVSQSGVGTSIGILWLYDTNYDWLVLQVSYHWP